LAAPAQMTEQQKRAALQGQLPDAGKLTKYIQQWGSVDKLYAFMKAIGDANFATLTADYYADKLKNLYDALAQGIRTAAMQKLAGLSQVSRDRIRDMYPHVDTKGGGYELNTNAQAAVLTALVWNGPFAAHQSGANLAMNPQGLLQDPNRANQLYTVLTGGGQGQKNYIFDSSGMGVAEVDFGNHGGDAVSGHCHPFGLPGCVAFAHHNAGGVHLGLNDYPIAWRALPGGVQPQTAIGT